MPIIATLLSVKSPEPVLAIIVFKLVVLPISVSSKFNASGETDISGFNSIRPLPLREIANSGAFGAFEDRCKVAACGPSIVGEKLTVIVQLSLGAIAEQFPSSI